MKLVCVIVLCVAFKKVVAGEQFCGDTDEEIRFYTSAHLLTKENVNIHLDVLKAQLMYKSYDVSNFVKIHDSMDFIALYYLKM